MQCIICLLTNYISSLQNSKTMSEYAAIDYKRIPSLVTKFQKHLNDPIYMPKNITNILITMYD